MMMMMMMMMIVIGPLSVSSASFGLILREWLAIKHQRWIGKMEYEEDMEHVVDWLDDGCIVLCNIMLCWWWIG